MKKLILVVFLSLVYLCFLWYKFDKGKAIQKAPKVHKRIKSTAKGTIRHQKAPNVQQKAPKVQQNYQQTINIEKWEKLLLPCENKINWISRERKTQNTTYARKTIVTTKKIKSTDNYKLTIITFNKDSLKKKDGGDWWAVKIKSTNISFSIHLVDNLDGSYEGVFSTPQAGNYSVDISLQYSLCHGIVDPPLDFFKNGSFQGLFQKIELPGDEFKKNRLPVKYIVVKHNNSYFHQCDNKLPVTCTHLNSKYGYWYNLKYIECWKYSDHYYKKLTDAVVAKTVNKSATTYVRSKLNKLVIYGDSITFRFYSSIKNKPICTNLFRKCIVVYTWAYVKERYSTEKEDHAYDGKDFNETIFFRGISDAVKDLKFMSKKNVILINFGMHTILNLQWERMKKMFLAFLDFIDKIKMQYGEFAPLFIWKTITEPNQDVFDKIRFMTKQRAHLWNEFTIHEACKRGLPILHLYHMSASFRKGPNDSNHYDNSAFYPAEEALYNYLKLRSFEKR